MDTESRLFLEQLFAGKPDELYVLLWTLPEKRSKWFRDVGEAVVFAESLSDHNLYVGVGLSNKDYGATQRCLSNEVGGIVGIWADIDLKSDAHPKAALPSTVEEALGILPSEFPPSFLISTGNGLHAWWLFREPLIFENDDERREAATLVNRWQTLLRLNAAARGWAFDRLADLARVLRVPGTSNCKDPQNLKPVSIRTHCDRRYNPSDFTEFLDDSGVPDEVEQERAAKVWTSEVAGQGLSADPSAAIPDELLNRYLDSDPRFKSTWLRQRKDLQDQSQSGYDMALANFGFDVGLTEQQVVDLIIHHRRIHGQRPRTRLEYFQRTISKAFKRNEGGVAPVSSQEARIEADVPSLPPRPDSVAAKALLCERISKAIGVRVLRIVKIDGQDPTYRLELENGKISFPSVDKLVGQQSFRMKIASAVEHLFPKIPGKTWERVAQAMFHAVTVEDGGDEADLVGAAKMYVVRYLSETPFIDAEEEQLFQSLYKPTVYEGQIAVRAQDLQQHINKVWGENRPIKDVTAMLSALGASSIRLKRTRLRDQSRWLLPANEFPVPDHASPGGGTDAQS
jgi:hypothetical protein